MTQQEKVAGLMLAALQTIQSNLTGRDCFAERVEASLRECRETIKHAQDAGVSPLHIGDYLYS